MAKKLIYLFALQMFAEAGTVTNTTTGTVNAYTGAATTTNALSVENKIFYDTNTLDFYREKAVFAQLGKKQVLPANAGRSVEVRKFDTLPDADKLQEAVIPEGKVLSATAITMPIDQYGLYVTVSDVLDMHAIDDVIVQATERVAYSASLTNEKLVRGVLMGNANTLFADILDPNGGYISTPTDREGLAAGKVNVAYLTPKMINKAVTILKKANAPTLSGGKYVAVIHPSVAEDLRESKAWIEAHKYSQTTEIFNGEIGELHGVRFVESNLAPVVEEGGVAVYLTMFFGADAFAVVDPQGAGMETIIKSREQAGGPLNQFSTVGAKFSMGAGILYPERMVTLESLSSYSEIDEANAA